MELESALAAVYEMLDGSDDAERYCERHGIGSAAILTVYDDERAAVIADYLSDRISGKTVIEVGGGIGLLGMYLAEYAKRVIIFEANPFWSEVYVHFLHKHKPKNLTFVFGSADEFAGELTADVALFCTHSDARGMRAAGELFAPVVIDVYAELLADNEHAREFLPMREMTAVEQFFAADHA